MSQFHKPADEKRMVVILPRERYSDWLTAVPEHSMALMQPFPSDHLQASAPKTDHDLFTQ
jgi:putative SOS response-associated peptidase YedK